MLGIETKRAELEIDISSLYVEIDELETAIDSGLDVQSVRMLAMQISDADSTTLAYQHANTSGSSVIESQLLPLLLEARSVQRRYGMEHPAFQGIQKQIDLLTDDENLGSLSADATKRSTQERMFRSLENATSTPTIRISRRARKCTNDRPR